MTTIQINKKNKKSKINKNIYGHFAEHLGRCIYNGFFVGENSDIPNVNGMRTDVVNALKHIKIPVLRWPGGCFADEYHWQDGIGKKEERKKMVNTHWGGVVEDNSFGTHEFMELCRQLECEPYINGNVGSGTVREMSEWVEYLTSGSVSPMTELRAKNGQKEPWRVKYWGVGNENWGCGGHMRPEYYADLYRQFATYIRNYGENKIYKIACGTSGEDREWTDVVMKIAGRFMHAITLHHYTFPGGWRDKGSATEFTDDFYYQTLRKCLRMDRLLCDHLQIMHRHDPEHRVALIVDEWGTWHNVEPGTNPGFLFQQNTMRDAMVAALTFNIFHKYSDRVQMANIAQTVNVLQAVILTEGDQMVLTPTYHTFDIYKPHMDATYLESSIQTAIIDESGEHVIPKVDATASIDEEGVLSITLVNPSHNAEANVEIGLTGIKPSAVTGQILTGEIRDKNVFGEEPCVKVQDYTDAKTGADGVTLTMPKCSIITLRVKQ